MSVVRFYGAKPDTYDHRDHRKRYSQSDIPPSWKHPNADLSEHVRLVYDQKDIGSCTANALCAAYALDLVKQPQTDYFNPSRLFLYYNTREREGHVKYDSGASIRETVKAMNCKGVCTESDWPYITSKFRSQPPQACYDAARGNNLCKYERLDQDIDHLRACLKKDNCPFAFGFKVYQSFHGERNQRYGDMSMPTAWERMNESDGRHAVVAVGYDDSRKRIKVLNSWGSGWGDRGYFYMPYDYITDSDLCYDFWKITFACERGKPRPKGTVACGSSGSGGSGYSASSWSGSGGGGACGYGGSPSYGGGRGWGNRGW